MDAGPTSEHAWNIISNITCFGETECIEKLVRWTRVRMLANIHHNGGIDAHFAYSIQGAIILHAACS